tara:strand:- start:1048 stop:1299 length:252 start_codon:yes stop_codon:yes gene_type:complete
MSWEDTLQKQYTGLNSIVDFIARLKDNIEEMEALARESFGDDPASTNMPFDVDEAKDILEDFTKFSKSVEMLFKQMIQKGELQ